MRISVCEFLRLTTQDNWFYLSPGNWVNSDLTKRVERQGEHVYHLREGRKPVKVLRYFVGLPSHEVRRRAKGKRRKK